MHHTDVESLKREVEYLQYEHVELVRTHAAEMKEKDASLAKRLKRAEKAERLVSALKRNRNELEVALRNANDEVKRSGLEIGYLKREIKFLRSKPHEAKQPSQGLVES